VKDCKAPLYIHGTVAIKVNIEGGKFVGYDGAAPKVTHKVAGAVSL